MTCPFNHSYVVFFKELFLNHFVCMWYALSYWHIKLELSLPDKLSISLSLSNTRYLLSFKFTSILLINDVPPYAIVEYTIMDPPV